MQQFHPQVVEAAAATAMAASTAASNSHRYCLRYAGATNRLDLAVCTVSAGREYHPTYRQPPQVHEDSFDPVLLLSDVPARHVVDSSPWLALYRGMATPYPSAEEGARYVYEVLLPFFVEVPLPTALGKGRRRRVCAADSTKC